MTNLSFPFETTNRIDFSVSDSGSDETFVSQVDRYFECLIYTGLSLLYYSSMMMITIDRFMICHLSINYSRYWNIRRTKILMYVIASVSVSMYVGVEIAYHITKQNINGKVHLFFYLPFDGLFVITAVTTYSRIFYQYVSIRRQAQSYGINNRVQTTTMENMTAMRETSTMTASEKIEKKAMLSEMIKSPATMQKTALEMECFGKDSGLIETPKTKAKSRKSNAVTFCFKESKFYVSFLLVTTFFLFIVTADLIYFGAIEMGRSAHSAVILNVIRISYTVSFLCDGFIYIVLDRHVRTRLLKALGMVDTSARSNASSTNGESRVDTAIGSTQKPVRLIL